MDTIGTNVIQRTSKYVKTMTPWGQADNVVKYAPGINFYSTPRHGGFKVSKKKNDMIPDYMRKNSGWYEEDCEFAIPVVFFSRFFTEDEYNSAKNTLKDWFPSSYERFFGVRLQKGDSYIRDKEIFEDENRDNFVVYSASISKLDNDMVIAHAKKESNDEKKSFLIPTHIYQKRENFGFVVRNVTQFQEVI